MSIYYCLAAGIGSASVGWSLAANVLAQRSKWFKENATKRGGEGWYWMNEMQCQCGVQTLLGFSGIAFSGLMFVAGILFEILT